MNVTDIMTVEEVAQAIRLLRKRKVHKNLAIFRLAVGCGLRRKEICGLDMQDVCVDGPRPGIYVSKGITKGRDGKRKSRFVPLWWDAGTLNDLANWKYDRIQCGANGHDPFVVGGAGKRLDIRCASSRFKTCIKFMHPDRQAQLSIHSGRHTFASHALKVGRSLVEVQQALGHASLANTTVYSHLIERNDIPDLYGGSRAAH